MKYCLGRALGVVLLPLFVHEALQSMESLHMRILARNGMGKMLIMLQGVLFMTSCVGKGVRENPPPATTRNATCTGKGGSESSRCDICASTRQPLEQIDDLLAIKCACTNQATGSAGSFRFRPCQRIGHAHLEQAGYCAYVFACTCSIPYVASGVFVTY